MKQLIALIEKEMSIKNLQSKLIILNLIFITTVVYLLLLDEYLETKDVGYLPNGTAWQAY